MQSQANRLPTLTDPRPTSESLEPKSGRWFLKFINDPRDMPFIWLCLQMTFILIPVAVILYVPGVFRWWMMPLYWMLLFGAFFDRYILMLHNTSHRRLFKREYKIWNNYIPWILGPFCGETPETYYAHHILMHHAEENLKDDLSTTMPYQRDSFIDFMKYFLDFMFLSMFKLTQYHLKKNRGHVARMLVLGELSFVLLCVGLSFVNAWATLTVFVVPFLLCRFLMMAGNWGQHAFIDPNDPGNPYRSATTFINARYNRRCFNDGYHIGHHVMGNRHWLEMPDDFLNDNAKYQEHDAMVFDGLDNFTLWFCLMTRQYKTLAKRFVDLSPNKRSEAEIIALMKSRAVPVM